MGGKVMTSILISGGLQLATLVVILLEIMLPSGGLLSILALGLLASSWFLILDIPYSWAPSLFLALDLILIPFTIYLGLKWMRVSPLSNRDELSSASGFQVQTLFPADLPGQIATVVTTLRPSGKIMCGGVLYEALSEGEFIDQGQSVIIKSILENKVIVERSPHLENQTQTP